MCVCTVDLGAPVRFRILLNGRVGPVVSRKVARSVRLTRRVLTTTGVVGKGSVYRNRPSVGETGDRTRRRYSVGTAACSVGGGPVGIRRRIIFGATILRSVINPKTF